VPSFDLAGPPDAPAIVFLHGAAFTRRMWLPQMDALAGEFRVIALDLPGHGAAAGRPFRLDQAVRDVVAIVDEHTQGRALLVGLSLGGYVAMVVARRSPCRTTGLVLSGCSVVYRGLRGGLARLNALLLRVYSERWLTRMNERTLRQMLPPALAEPQIAAGFYWKAAGQGFGTIAGEDVRPALRAYPYPVLILNGADDRLNRAGEAALAVAARDATVRIIAAAGHGVNLEQPEAFTAAVRAFAQSLASHVDAPTL